MLIDLESFIEKAIRKIVINDETMCKLLNVTRCENGRFRHACAKMNVLCTLVRK